MTKTAQKNPLIVEQVHVDDLKYDPKNARIHPERNLAAICQSLERFGQQKPIVVGKDNVVIAGNGALEAARKLGWTHIDVVRTELTGNDAIAFAIADNRTSDLSAWDAHALNELLSQLQSDGVELVGWSDKEFERLVDSIEPPEPPAEFNTVDESIKTDFECPKCGFQWSGKQNQS